MCSVCSLDSCFHVRWLNTLSRDIALSFDKSLVILKLKPFRRFSWTLAVMSWVKLSKWYNCFKHSQTSVQSEACSGRPFTSQSGNKHLISAFYFKRGFVQMESVGGICPQLAAGALEATLHRNLMILWKCQKSHGSTCEK